MSETDNTACDVRARTDSGYCGWWCDTHQLFTGQRGWCPMDERESPPLTGQILARAWGSRG